MKANFNDWRVKSSFSQWERACLLADVEPYSEMTGDEMQNVRQQMERFEALDKFLTSSESDLFKRLLMG